MTVVRRPAAVPATELVLEREPIDEHDSAVEQLRAVAVGRQVILRREQPLEVPAGRSDPRLRE